MGEILKKKLFKKMGDSKEHYVNMTDNTDHNMKKANINDEYQGGKWSIGLWENLLTLNGFLYCLFVCCCPLIAIPCAHRRSVPDSKKNMICFLVFLLVLISMVFGGLIGGGYSGGSAEFGS